MVEFDFKKFNTYAQWSSVITCLTAFICAAATIINIPFLPFVIAAFIIGLLIVFIEIPFCIKCCPTSEGFNGFIKSTQNHWARTGMYLVFATVLWLSTIVGASAIIAPAFFATLTCAFYLGAGLRGETRNDAIVNSSKWSQV